MNPIDQQLALVRDCLVAILNKAPDVKCTNGRLEVAAMAKAGLVALAEYVSRNTPPCQTPPENPRSSSGS